MIGTALDSFRSRQRTQGQAEAQSNLGSMYYRGRGVPREFAEAVNWYGKAADQGWSRAQAVLGLMYSEGKGAPQDYVLAHKWLNLAASKLPPGEDRERVVKLRDLMDILMTPTQIAEAQRLAREWLAKHPSD